MWSEEVFMPKSYFHRVCFLKCYYWKEIVYCVHNHTDLYTVWSLQLRWLPSWLLLWMYIHIDSEKQVLLLQVRILNVSMFYLVWLFSVIPFSVAEVQAIASMIEKQAQIVVKHKEVSEESKKRKEALLAQYANVTDEEEYP